MDIIDDQTIVVYNHGDLNTALSVENAYIITSVTEPITLTESFVNVHTAGPYDDILFSIVWDNSEGVLARISAPIYVEEAYTANLNMDSASNRNTTGRREMSRQWTFWMNLPLLYTIPTI